MTLPKAKEEIVVQNIWKFIKKYQSKKTHLKTSFLESTGPLKND